MTTEFLLLRPPGPGIVRSALVRERKRRRSRQLGKGIHIIYVLIWTIAIITEDSRSVGLATHSHEFASYEACQAAKEQLSKTKPLLSSFSQFEITADCYAKGPAPAQSPN